MKLHYWKKLAEKVRFLPPLISEAVVLKESSALQGKHIIANTMVATCRNVSTHFLLGLVEGVVEILEASLSIIHQSAKGSLGYTCE